MTPLRIPVHQLAWATDLHLVFVRGRSLEEFHASLAQTSADAIAISGDISDGRWLERHLSMIARSVQKPIFVVLGNYDRYHTSFADAEEQVRRVVEIRGIRARSASRSSHHYEPTSIQLGSPRIPRHDHRQRARVSLCTMAVVFRMAKSRANDCSRRGVA